MENRILDKPHKSVVYKYVEDINTDDILFYLQHGYNVIIRNPERNPWQ